MKAVNCKSVYLQVEEAEPGWKPSEAVMEHLSKCGRCQTFYEERVKLRQLVGSLGTVKAPPDFDFRLRARLASEKPGLGGRFSWAGFSFGVRTVTLVALVLLLGTVFLIRVLRIRPDYPLASVESPKSSVVSINPNASINPKETASGAGADATSDETKGKPRETLVQGNRGNAQRRQTVATNSRTISSDFSSQPAQVVKRRDPSGDAASVFPIDASHEFLKMSLDDSTGVSRTISLPRVSFGSQRLVAGESSSMVKTSAKGVW